MGSSPAATRTWTLTWLAPASRCAASPALMCSGCMRPPPIRQSGSRRYLQSADRVAIDIEAVTQVDGSTWKVSFQVNAGDVASFTRGLHSDQLSGVLVDRCDVFSPRADLFRAVHGLAFVDDDGIVGKERDECVEVTCGLGS